MKQMESTEQCPSPYVLVVLPSDEYRASLLNTVELAGMVPLSCQSAEEAMEAMNRESLHAVVCEDILPEIRLKSIFDLARTRTNPVPVIVTSRTGEWDEYLKALRLGAFDYLVLPPQCDEVKRVLGLALVEATRNMSNEAVSDRSSVSATDSLSYSFDDRWDARLTESAAGLSRPFCEVDHEKRNRSQIESAG